MRAESARDYLDELVNWASARLSGDEVLHLREVSCGVFDVCDVGVRREFSPHGGCDFDPRHLRDVVEDEGRVDRVRERQVVIHDAGCEGAFEPRRKNHQGVCTTVDCSLRFLDAGTGFKCIKSC